MTAKIWLNGREIWHKRGESYADCYIPYLEVQDALMEALASLKISFLLSFDDGEDAYGDTLHQCKITTDN